MKFLKYCSTNSNGGCTLLIHGGTFVRGNEKWNKQQARELSSVCDVYTIDFGKDDINVSVGDICSFYNKLYLMYNSNITLIGTSSGGYLVLHVLKFIKEPKRIILICPVLNPKARETISTVDSKIINRQFEYFKNKVPHFVENVSANFLVIGAKDDVCTPMTYLRQCMNDYPSGTLIEIDGGHEVSFKACSRVSDIVKCIAFVA